MKAEDIELIINRANELWKAGACMGSGYDEDNPMTTLEEALVFFVMEDEELVMEVSGEDLYDKLTKLKEENEELRQDKRDLQDRIYDALKQ